MRCLPLRRSSIRLFVAALACAAGGQALAEQSHLDHNRFKWRDAGGNLHYSDVLPPAIHDETPLTIAELIVALGPLAHVDAHRIAFVNGHHRAEFDDLRDASGLDVTTLGKTLSSAPTNVADALTKSDANGAIAALNAAFMTDGAIVRVADKATLAKPLLVVFVRAGSAKQTVTVRNFVSIRWQGWFDMVGKRISAVRIVDTAYDPPNIAAGATLTVNVTVSGVSPGDFAEASFETGDASIRVLADVTAANTVSVTFWNTSGGAIDLAAGTLRVRVENKP